MNSVTEALFINFGVRFSRGRAREILSDRSLSVAPLFMNREIQRSKQRDAAVTRATPRRNPILSQTLRASSVHWQNQKFVTKSKLVQAEVHAARQHSSSSTSLLECVKHKHSHQIHSRVDPFQFWAISHSSLKPQPSWRPTCIIQRQSRD